MINICQAKKSLACTKIFANEYLHAIMKCYLCNNDNITKRNGSVRDSPNIGIFECGNCGLVFLESSAHITPGHYENSGMHGFEVPDISSWLRETDVDDERRYQMLKTNFTNKSILDFGCGAAGFLWKTNSYASNGIGVELEQRVREYWKGKLKIVSNLEEVMGKYDLITAFHVIEHLVDPVKTLRQLANLMQENGRLVIEVPNSDDALLTLYDSINFKNFTYWSQHLYMFNSSTLKILANLAGLRVISIEQHQRYPLSNHVYWLSKGQPGGHMKWNFLDRPILTEAYAASLAVIGKCDTLIAHLEKG